METIKRSELSNLKMIAGNEHKFTKIIDNNDGYNQSLQKCVPPLFPSSHDRKLYPITK